MRLLHFALIVSSWLRALEIRLHAFPKSTLVFCKYRLRGPVMPKNLIKKTGDSDNFFSGELLKKPACNDSMFLIKGHIF